MRFIKDHFDLYDAEKFSDAWKSTLDPLMIVCQIGFWIYSYFFAAEKTTSISGAILEALYYGFGGIIFSVIIYVVIMCVAYAINKKPAGFIMLAIGIIGAVLAFMRLY